MRSVYPSKLLQVTLTADAGLSVAFALSQLTIPRTLSKTTNLPQELLVGTGMFLIVCSVILYVLARRDRIRTALIALIIVGNCGWAFGCVELLTSSALTPSVFGAAYLILQGAAALVFAALQFAGLRSSDTVLGFLKTQVQALSSERNISNI